MLGNGPQQNFRTVHNNATKRETDCYIESNIDKLRIANRIWGLVIVLLAKDPTRKDQATLVNSSH